MIGSYRVKQLVKMSCQLDLPILIKIHDVFHPSLLQKTAENPLPGQHNDLALPVIVNDKEKQKVNDILDVKKKGGKKARKKEEKVGGKIQFCVKQKRYNENKEQYDAEGFKHSKKLIKDFYKRNPTKL